MQNSKHVSSIAVQDQIWPIPVFMLANQIKPGHGNKKEIKINLFKKQTRYG